MRVFGKVFCVFLFLYLFCLYIIGSIVAKGVSSFVPDPVPPAYTVSFQTSDNVRIVGTYSPGLKENSPGILLLHGMGANRFQVASTAAFLSKQGYATLAIDFRGHGQSQMASRTLGAHEALDAHAAFDFLRKKQHGADLGVIGISLGGAAALIGDAGPLPAKAMVLQAVYPDIHRAIANRFVRGPLVLRGIGYVTEPLLRYQMLLRFSVWPSQMSPVESLRSLHSAVFIIGGEKDIFTPPSESREMYDAASGSKEIWIVHGRDHNRMSGMRTVEYEDRVLSFFKRNLGSP